MTINPELLLAAAKLAIPNISWEISDGLVADADSPPFYADRFNPLHPADHDALVDVLLRHGWCFSHETFRGDEPPAYLATLYGSDGELLHCIQDESRPICTLKAVATQTGISLYVEDKSIASNYKDHDGFNDYAGANVRDEFRKKL